MKRLKAGGNREYNTLGGIKSVFFSTPLTMTRPHGR